MKYWTQESCATAEKWKAWRDWESWSNGGSSGSRGVGRSSGSAEANGGANGGGANGGGADDGAGGGAKGGAGRGAPGKREETLALRLDYRPPLDWEALLRFLAGRAIPGVERVADGSYARTVRLGAVTGWIVVRHDAGGTRSSWRRRCPWPGR